VQVLRAPGRLGQCWIGGGGDGAAAAAAAVAQVCSWPAERLPHCPGRWPGGRPWGDGSRLAGRLLLPHGSFRAATWHHEFATSSDGMTWQAVRFRGGLGADQGFGFQGLSEQLMLGRLAAAGVAELSDNMWLLHVADMLLEVS